MEETKTQDAIVDLAEAFADERGRIQILLEGGCESVLVITSKADSVRANHYHQRDSHYCYVESGRIEYHHRPVGSTDAATVETIEAGQLFYTPPMVEHAMKFLEDTTFYAFTKQRRDQEAYEDDTVRVELL